VEPPGSAEHEVQAWLDTIDASAPRTLQSLPASTPTSTIVPHRGDRSARHAADFLAQLAERGRPIELRTGKLIGEGGMGVVHEAEQVALGRTVAVKTVKPVRRDAAAASDLLREAWVTGALEHPNVVPVHHLEIDDGLMPLLILKRVDGVEWSALAGDAAEVQRRFGSADLLAWNLGILVQVLNALRFAHARGVIHRDLKPSNVMIGNFGEVYLLDWGIALRLHDDGTGRFPLVSEATELAGTPSYMAPEMLRHEDAPPLSARTDVYLAGAVLFELIAGRPPHQGTTAIAILSSIVLSKPALPADAPAELAQICMRAMNQDPAQRYESIEALQLAIQGYLEHRGSSRLTSGATLRLGELITLAASNRADQREELYRQLAICRFAFHEALAVWRDNADARAGLSRANVAVAEYELACGDPRAAVTLLSEVGDRSALLDKAQLAALAAQARQAQLEELRRDVDPTLHPNTRRILGFLCALFILLPMIAGLRPEMGLKTHAEQVGFALGCALLFVVISVIVRRKPMTAINRRVFAGAAFLFFSQAMLAVGMWIMNLSIVHTQVFNIIVWAALGGIFALVVDRWLFVNSVGYFVGFVIAARWPDVRMFVVSGGNLVLAANLLLRWRPVAQHLSRGPTT
jgi:serine/threonine protein kinase